jgi:hypothetical protein
VSQSLPRQKIFDAERTFSKPRSSGVAPTTTPEDTRSWEEILETKRHAWCHTDYNARRYSKLRGVPRSRERMVSHGLPRQQILEAEMRFSKPRDSGVV